MRFKILALIAAGVLLTACETAPEETGAAGGTGGAGAPVVTQPQPAPPVDDMRKSPQEVLVTEVGDRVFFDFDKFDLTSEAQETLRRQAEWMQQNPEITVTIEGHADERGTREYNLALGERRANSVKDFLSALGVARTRIDTISYGKERPVALGHNEAAWSQNRRGVTVITGGAPGS